MKRLFLAIKITPDEKTLSLLNELKSHTLYDKIKWVDKDNLHLTIKFFGEINENKIPEIIKNINTSIKNKKELSLELSEIGIFGSRYNPKVIWLGIKKTIYFENLATEIIDHLTVSGFEKDRQNFIPHLTIGRIQCINNKIQFNSQLKKIDANNIQIVMIDKIYLFESILYKEGPKYTVIEEFILDK